MPTQAARVDELTTMLRSDLPDAFVLQQLRALMPKQSNSPVRSGGIGLPWVLLARHLPPTW